MISFLVVVIAFVIAMLISIIIIAWIEFGVSYKSIEKKELKRKKKEVQQQEVSKGKKW